MKKVFLIFIFCLFLVGCKKEVIEVKDTNIINEKQQVLYGEDIYLNDLVVINNGNIISENTKINTMTLGKQALQIKYTDINNEEKIYDFKIEVIDNIAPQIFSSRTYTTVKGKDIDIANSALCADNYDRNLKCKISGKYDITKAGTYELKLTATDSSNNYNERDIKLVIKEEKEEDNTTSYYYLKDLIGKYKNNNTMIGIDVSTWQGYIDWEKVKASGVEFAMIRIGFGHYEDEIVLDNKYERNIKLAQEAGIKVGVYFFSYAKNEEEAREEAKWVISKLNNEKLDLPISFDWEIWYEYNNYNLNTVELNNIAKTFLEEIEKAGYQGMNYGSATYLEKIWNIQEYKTWVAYYTDNNDFEKEFYIWQLTSSGIVNGINGRVDLNILYK